MSNFVCMSSVMFLYLVVLGGKTFNSGHYMQLCFIPAMPIDIIDFNHVIPHALILLWSEIFLNKGNTFFFTTASHNF